MNERQRRRPLPTFRSEAEERQFWETHDTGPFVDWSRARIAVFPNLKPSTETISLRLPVALLSEIKLLANKYDVPYQSLLKMFLAERVARESGIRTALANQRLQPQKARRRSTKKRSQRPRIRG